MRMWSECILILPHIRDNLFVCYRNGIRSSRDFILPWRKPGFLIRRRDMRLDNPYSKIFVRRRPVQYDFSMQAVALAKRQFALRVHFLTRRSLGLTSRRAAFHMCSGGKHIWAEAM